MTAWKTENKIDTGEGEIYYWSSEHFPGHPTIICLHGLSANHTTWDSLASALSEEKYNCLALDIRGHGKSDKTINRSFYRWERLREDLESIIKKEKLSKIFLVGYSFGGTMALDFGVNAPGVISGLVLFSTNHFSPLRTKTIFWLNRPVYAFLRAMSFLFSFRKKQEFVYYDPSRNSGYWQSTFDGLKTMPAAVNLWLLSMLAKIDLSQRVKEINCPAILVFSKGDFFLGQEEIDMMIAAMPQAESKMLFGRSHFIATEQKEEVAATVIDFIKRYENSAF